MTALDFLWTMRCVIAWYFLRNSLSLCVDSIDSDRLRGPIRLSSEGQAKTGKQWKQLKNSVKLAADKSNLYWDKTVKRTRSKIPQKSMAGAAWNFASRNRLCLRQLLVCYCSLSFRISTAFPQIFCPLFSSVEKTSQHCQWNIGLYVYCRIISTIFS